MDEKTKPTDERAVEAAKKKDDGAAGPAILTRLKDLERENKALKAQVAELQKRVQELEAEQKAAACRSRAKKLLTRSGEAGARLRVRRGPRTELKRLAGLSDDAFAATEAAYERLPKAGSSGHSEDKEAKDRGPGGKPRRRHALRRPAPAQRRGCPSAGRGRQQGVARGPAEDGFMAAYRNRVGEDSPEHSQINA